MILIVGSRTDPAIEPVLAALDRRQAQFTLVDPSEIAATGRVAWVLPPSSVSPSATLSSAFGPQLNSGDITAAWWWHPSTPALTGPELDRTVLELCNAEWDWFLRGVWRTIDCYWLNHPARIREAENKPKQLKMARHLGFNVPDTLITNDPRAIAAFFNRHEGRIIRKSIHTPRVETPGGIMLFYTEVVDRADLRDLGALALCPAIFQELLEKEMDLRVTVVGDEVFAAEIHSQRSEISRTDYRRYDFENTPYRVHDLPDELAELCRSITRSLDLDYGAIDLVRTQEDRYVFLEINPSGQFGWIESLTELPISRAIADRLIRSARPAPSPRPAVPRVP